MEEGGELLRRLEASCAPAAAEHDTNTEHHAPGPLPMFTSCCPGWVAMAEKSAPELLPYLSTCKSPHMMLGAVLKGFWASHAGVPARDVEVVSIMPCVRKQGEADRPWFATALNADGSLAAAEGEEGGMVVRDVDHVITTAELGKALVERGIDLAALPVEEFDNPLGVGSGGGLLFGTTGGVMEAALRTVYEVASGQPMERLNYEEVRGLEGIKEATVRVPLPAGSKLAPLAGADGGSAIELHVAVANGLGNAKKLIKTMSDDTAAGAPRRYDFIEVMACPGGCIGGGGQPRSADKGILGKRQVGGG